jgi:hypothetical protein
MLVLHMKHACLHMEHVCNHLVGAAARYDQFYQELNFKLYSTAYTTSTLLLTHSVAAQ